ncbi:unnamed protein product, partial [Prorocentrum cordatum]
MPRALAAASTRRRTGACHERGECSRLPTCSGGRSSHAHADTRARRIFGVAPSMPRPSTGPRGSVRAARWLPQQRVGKPSLDIFVVETPSQKPEDRYYISNDEFHCNKKVCTQVWKAGELASLRSVAFGAGSVWVPIGASSYLSRVYGEDWSVTVRPHRWAAELGHGFG